MPRSVESITPEEIEFMKAVFKNRYPQYVGYMEIPELARVLTAGAINELPDNEIQGQVYQTYWYQNTPKDARDFVLGQVADPASVEQQVGLKATEYRQRLGQMGVPYDDAQLRDFAKFQLMTGASDQTMLAEMVAHFSQNIPAGATSLQVGGALGNQMSGVKANAYEYGVRISDDQARFFATGLLTGAANQETVDDFMRDQAKLMFPSIADKLDQGYTVRQYADPYIQTAASELEMNPNDIDLSDPKYGRVLQPFNDAPLPLYDWQRIIRTDESYGWDKTTGAQTTAAQLTTQLGKTFGAL